MEIQTIEFPVYNQIEDIINFLIIASVYIPFQIFNSISALLGLFPYKNSVIFAGYTDF